MCTSGNQSNAGIKITYKIHHIQCFNYTIQHIRDQHSNNKGNKRHMLYVMYLVCSMATQKCHDGPCGPCSLCKMHSSKYTHPERFNTEQYTFLCEVEEREVSKIKRICYCCSKQIKRNVRNHQLEVKGQRMRGVRNT